MTRSYTVSLPSLLKAEVQSGKNPPPEGVIAGHVDEAHLDAVELTGVIEQANGEASLRTIDVIHGGNRASLQRTVADVRVARGHP